MTDRSEAGADESRAVVPAYYRVRTAAGEVCPMDVTDALDMNFNQGCALKYLWRAGRKPGEPYAKDLRKALRCIQRELARLERIERARSIDDEPAFAPLIFID